MKIPGKSISHNIPTFLKLSFTRTSWRFCSWCCSSGDHLYLEHRCEDLMPMLTCKITKMRKKWKEKQKSIRGLLLRSLLKAVGSSAMEPRMLGIFIATSHAGFPGRDDAFVGMFLFVAINLIFIFLFVNRIYIILSAQHILVHGMACVDGESSGNRFQVQKSLRSPHQLIWVSRWLSDRSIK